MKRRIIQIAESTVLVSLPSKWVKKHNLKKGDEVEVKERGTQIIIETDNKDITKKLQIDATTINERALRYTLGAALKLGFTEIEIKYDSKEQLETVNDILKNLYVGFASMEQKSNKITLKKISKDLEEEFNPSFRRAFLVTISLSDSVLDCIKKSEFNSLLELINLEKTNNQLTNFCERMLNDGIYEHSKTTFLYTILWNLEKIADEYKYLCKILNENKIDLNKNTIKLLEETNRLLRDYYNLSYEFKIEKINDLEELRNDINLKYLECLKNNNNIELEVINHIIAIASKCSDFTTNIIGLNISEDLRKFSS